jgi:transposase-like protein
MKHFECNHSNDRKRYTCDLCGDKLADKNSILKHLLKVHLNIRNFKCKFCDDPNVAFKNKVALNTHLYRAHDVDAPYRCPDCKEGFTYQSQLKFHTHCPATVDRVRRVRNRGNPDDFKNLKCNVCEKTYR